MGYNQWGHKELDTTERLTLTFIFIEISFIMKIYMFYIYVYKVHFCEVNLF